HLLASLVFDRHARADSDGAAPCGRFVDDDGAVEPVAENRDPPFEQSLFVLRRVVLEVLRKVAETPRSRDRLDRLRAPRAFELRELRLELRLLRRGQRLRFVAGTSLRVSVRLLCNAGGTGLASSRSSRGQGARS